MLQIRSSFVLAGVVTTLLTGCAASQRAPLVREGRIDVDGGQVWYRIVGADRPGVPLLVLHGGPGVPHDYLEPVAALATERPVVFYDQLGCGNSDRPAGTAHCTIQHYVRELAAVRAALQLDRVHILGHSWGTMLAVDYMLETQPDGVVSLTLAGPALSARRWIADQRVWLLELPEDMQAAVHRAEETGDFAAPEYHAATQAFYAQHVCRTDPWPDHVQRALSPEKFGEEVYLSMWGPSEFTATGSLRTYERVARLAEINTPTLFMCGQYDEATPAATEFYHRNMPGSDYAVVANASHLAWTEQPAACNRLVRAFLKQAERQGRQRRG